MNILNHSGTAKNIKKCNYYDKKNMNLNKEMAKENT